MKKSILTSLLFLSSFVTAQTTVNVSADLKSITGAASPTDLARVQVCFSLVAGDGSTPPDPHITGSGVIIPFKNKCFKSADGSINTVNGHFATAMIANDQITTGGVVGGTLWSVSYVISGSYSSGGVYSFLLADVTEDLNSKLPAVVVPIVPAGTADGTYMRLDGGNSPATGAWQFNAAVTHVGSLFANPIISTSSNPATTGTIRLASGDSIGFRNAANSGNVLATKSGAASGTLPADYINLSAFGGVRVVAVISNTGNAPASVGLVRAINNENIVVARTAANDADIALLNFDSGNIINIGKGSGNPPVAIGSSLVVVESSAPAGVTGQDILWGDSTNHRLQVINNNGSTEKIATNSSTDGFTNKTFDTASTGNVFKVNGQTVSAFTGTGASVVLAASPSITNPVIGSGVGCGTGYKAGRVTTGSIATATRADVTLNFCGSAFADTNYSPVCMVIDTSAAGTGLRIERLRAVNVGSLVAQIVNDSGGSLTGTLSCTMTHD